MLPRVRQRGRGATRSVRARALVLLGGVALLQVAVGTALVAGTTGGTPDLALTSDTDGSPLVAASAMAPGHTVTRCLQLGYANAVTADRLRLMTTSSGALADRMTVRVEAGTGGSSASCTGFSGTTVYSGTLTDLSQQHGTAQSALALRTLPDGNGTVSIRLRFTVNSDNAAQGTSTSADLTWIAEAVGDRTPPPPVVTPVDPPPTTPPVITPPSTTPPVPQPPAPAPQPTVDAPAPTATTPVPPANVPTVEPSPVATAATPHTPAPAPSTASTPPSVAGATEPSATPAPAAGGPSTPPTRPDAGSAGGGGVQAVGHALSSGARAVASAAGSIAHAMRTQVIAPVAAAAAPAARGAGYGLGGTAPLLGAFLLIQGRIDRRDPKLALAPAYADPELTFNDIPRGPLTFRAPTDPALDLSPPEPGTTS